MKAHSKDWDWLFSHLDDAGKHALEAMIDAHEKSGGGPWRDAFIEKINESSYTVAAWIEGILAVEEFLATESRSCPDLNEKIGYVHCTTMAAEGRSALPHLATLVREMLDTYGFAER